MDTQIRFKARDVSLEGSLRIASKSHAVILTHPHPLYGGDMHNSVVNVAADGYAQQGWTVLRFNFRGTGMSQGHHEDGVGEQEDLQAALDYLLAAGFRDIDLAGYSFGAWVIAQWSRNHPGHSHRIILIAPPVSFVDFDCHTPIPGLRHIITGSLDDLAPPAPIRSALPRWQPGATLCIIPGADHSFWGHFQVLRQKIIETANMS